MKYQALIFDFDYTLGDSTEGIIESANYALKATGHPAASRESIQRTVGLSLKETYRALTADDSQGQAALFDKYFKEKADQVMVENTTMYPEALDLLRSLKGQNIPAGIVTTKFHYRIDAILEKCRGTEYVGLIIGGEDVKSPKPDPEGIFQALDIWKLPIRQALYIGDSLVDAKTAENAGIDFAGVTTGATSKAELGQYPSIGIYESLRQLKADFPNF